MRYIIFLFLLSGVFHNSYAQNDVARLVTSMLGETPIEEDLQELCDEIGGRLTGSLSNFRSIEWAYKKFKDIGINVRRDAFEMPVLWIPQSTESSLFGFKDFHPTLVSKYQTPRGQYKGKIVSVGNGDEAHFVEKAAYVKGNIIIVESELCLDINGLFAEYAFAANVEVLSEKYEAQGIIFMSSRPKGLLYRFISSKGIEATMPQFVMNREDAQRIIRLIDGGRHMEIEINVNVKSGGTFQSHNVIAEIPGTEKPDEIILIGAHLDSWALGTGANDNGCNVNLVIDIARQMMALGIKPKRTIRFALWNGEEQGYFGSWDYTKENIETLDKHLMALSIDIGSGPINGFFTNGRSELMEILEVVLDPVDSLGTFNHLNIPIVGTDNFDFMLQGVPNLVANHNPFNYGLNYHASSDTYDKVDLKSLKVNSAIVAALTLGFANLDDDKAMSLKRQTRQEIQQIFDDSKLEFTMRMFNVWEPWINGERGRN